MITYTIYCMRQVLRLLQTQELDRTISDYPLPVALSYMISHAILILVHPYIYINIYITCDKYITCHTITNGTNTNCIYHYSVVVLVMTQQYTRLYNLYQLIYIYKCIYIIYGQISIPYITGSNYTGKRHTRIHARYTGTVGSSTLNTYRYIHAIVISTCQVYTYTCQVYNSQYVLGIHIYMLGTPIQQLVYARHIPTVHIHRHRDSIDQDTISI